MPLKREIDNFLYTYEDLLKSNVYIYYTPSFSLPFFWEKEGTLLIPNYPHLNATVFLT